MAAEVLEFDLKAKNNGLKTALTDASSQADKLSSKLNGAFDGTKLASYAKNLASAYISMKILTDSIDAFTQKEDAINRVAQSFKATGNYSAEAVDDVVAFADAIESTSVFADDAVLNQVALARSMGLTTAQAKDVVKAAANMSAALGGDLESNVRKLAQSLDGNGQILGKVSPQFRQFTEEQFKAGAAIKFVNEKFSGAAASQLNTYSGSMVQLGNEVNNLSEALGGLIVGATKTSGVLGLTINILKTMNDGVKNINAALGNGTALENYQFKLGDLAIKAKAFEKEISFIQKTINNPGEASFLDRIAVSTGFADSRLKELQKQLDATRQKMGELEAPKSNPLAGETSSIGSRQSDTDKTAAEAALKAQQDAMLRISNAKKQIALEDANFAAELRNTQLADEQKRNAEELTRLYEFDQEKRLLQQQLDLEKAAATMTGKSLALEQEAINKQAELDLLARSNKLEIDMIKLQNEEKKKLDDKAKKDKEESLQATLSITQSAFSIMSSMAKAGGKEQYRIQKASAIAESFIAIQLAIAKATSSAPFPANLPAIAAVAAQGASLISKIKGSSGPGYAEGGIIGGATRGGDNRTAQVRDGEMVLNADQQKRLFDAINSGSIGGAPIVVQIDGREIARAVRTQKQQGFAV